MNNDQIRTIGDVMNAMSRVLKSPNPQAAADDLMQTLLARTPNASADVGYLAGYFSDDEAEQIYRLFRTKHPVFGTTKPTPEEAFAAGVQMAKRGVP